MNTKLMDCIHGLAKQHRGMIHSNESPIGIYNMACSISWKTFSDSISESSTSKVHEKTFPLQHHWSTLNVVVRAGDWETQIPTQYSVMLCH